MDDTKIISFEEYRRKKAGSDYQEDPLSSIFKKDLREQTELISWYTFHNKFNKHKLFVHTLFKDNHEVRDTNPNCGYLLAFNTEQISRHISFLTKALKWENRNFTIIPAAGCTIREIGMMLTGIPHRDTSDVYKSFRRILLESNKVIVIQELSKSKMTYKKNHFARLLIKVLDDAHFDGIHPDSDLIFIDYANFLQKSWQDIGFYLEILTPI